MPDEHLHEDRLEPDAHAVEARQLMFGQRDPLLFAHPVPQRRAIQGAAVRGNEVAVRPKRGVPVDLDGRVEGMLG
jgi:hypothetical protein